MILYIIGIKTVETLPSALASSLTDPHPLEGEINARDENFSDSAHVPSFQVNF